MARKKSPKDKIENGNENLEAQEKQPTMNGGTGNAANCGIVEEESEEGLTAESLEGIYEELELQKKDIADQKDKYLRLMADYDNFRKRYDMEIERARKFGIDNFARAMLDVMESLEKACEIEHLENLEATVSSIQEGVELTRKQLQSAFKSFYIEEIDPQPGTPFDAKFHQAMTMLPNAEIPPNHISEVFRKGYRLHDRLLRPAMVIVASAVKDGVESENTNESEPNDSENS